MKRIGVLGHVGSENLGDEAVLAAVIQQVRSRYPDAEIIAFTGNPEDTRQRHGITAFPIRRSRQGESAQVSRLTARVRAVTKAAPRLQGLLRGFRNSARFPRTVLGELMFLAHCRIHLKDVDLLIIAGSNQLNDYFGGPWAFPYTLLKWCILAKWVRARVAFLCCGAGPLRSRLGRLFVKYSLLLANYRSYRDEGSRRLIESIGVTGDQSVGADLAYSLRLVVQSARPRPAASRPIVGINPLPFLDQRYWPEHNAEAYQQYVRKLAAFAGWLNEQGHPVWFFPTQLRADPPVIQDITGLLPNGWATQLESPPDDRPLKSLDDLMLRISTMNIVVASRYHGVLLAALLHKPVIAIAYYEKTRDLMAQIGQSDYVVDINSFDTASLVERFVAMESQTEAIRQAIEQRTRALRRALEREYDHVLRLLEPASRAGPADRRVGALARLDGHA